MRRGWKTGHDLNQPSIEVVLFRLLNPTVGLFLALASFSGFFLLSNIFMYSGVVGCTRMCMVLRWHCCYSVVVLALTAAYHISRSLSNKRRQDWTRKGRSNHVYMGLQWLRYQIQFSDDKEWSAVQAPACYTKRRIVNSVEHVSEVIAPVFDRLLIIFNSP